MITDYKNKHLGRGCFVLGNGPSLRDVPLNTLEYMWPTFGTNRVYLSGHVPTYYACVNPLVLSQFHDEIAALDTIKFIPKHLPFENQAGTVVRIDTSLGIPYFSNPEGPIWEGHTVTFVCLQLAYYMGFDTVYLLGVDHDYGDYRRPNLEMVATGPDAHHFDPSYFSRGVRWNAPDLARSELAYSLAKAQFEKDGRAIYNCSKRSKLTMFDYLSADSILDGGPRVSVIVSAYKAMEFLNELIVDLEEQTIYNDLEIIFVCQEGSEEAKCVENVDNAIVLLTPNIPTVYKAWNIGVEHARGKYITNANTDDRHHPLAFEIMANLLDARPDIDLVYHDSYVTWVPNTTFSDFEQSTVERLVAGREEGKPGIMTWPDYNQGLLLEGCYMGPQPMWRAALHQRHGLFTDAYKSAGDYEFWLRIAKPANMLHIPYPLGLYLARMDGIELSNPILSAEESASAKIINQNPDGAALTPEGPYLRIRLGGEYTYADPQAVIEALGKMYANVSIPVP